MTAYSRFGRRMGQVMANRITNPKTLRVGAEVLFLVVFASVVGIWFKAGYVISGVDITWPLSSADLLQTRWYAWYEQFNGGTDRSINVASLPFFVVPAFFEAITGSVAVAQALAYYVWFLLVMSSMYILMWQLVPTFSNEGSVTRLVAAATYSVNFYLFFVWVRLQLGLAGMVLLPVLLTLLIARRHGRISWFGAGVIWAPVSLLCASIGIQPPLMGSIVLAVVLFLLFALFFMDRDWRKWLDIVGMTFFLGVVFLLVNAFWVFGLINFIIDSGYSSGSTGREIFKVDTLLATVSKFTDPINVVTNIADFAYFDEWGGGYYYPMMLAYREDGLLIISGVIWPALAVIGLMFWRHPYAAYFGALAVVGILLSMGTHPPLGIIYGWLIDHVPGFWIFRAPWQKFGNLTTLAYAVLMGVASGYIYSRLARIPSKVAHE